ncbi:ras-like GTP-binding protein YPT1 [Centruroides sculpturatus]|uniref:ras-like GTP-binding protein YPT1 n=1 Tax=Centruroides sculpturatus TaxID=218467 RepID=UPI000C6D7EDD|nr:ras-like GTP-binding protein YPT1 [Centruroides sculpturatus]
MCDYTHQFGVIVIGDSACGKTALVKRFTTGTYNPSYDSTIGVDFALKLVEVNKVKIRLQIWDTAGQERFRSISHAYYRKASGVFLAYDVNDRVSFRHILDWLKQARKYTDNPIFQVVGCKADLNNSPEVSTEEGRQFAKVNGFKFFETSAKNNLNVEKPFVTMATDIYKKFVPIKNTPDTHFSQINLKPKTPPPQKTCSICT